MTGLSYPLTQFLTRPNGNLYYLYVLLHISLVLQYYAISKTNYRNYHCGGTTARAHSTADVPWFVLNDCRMCFYHVNSSAQRNCQYTFPLKKPTFSIDNQFLRFLWQSVSYFSLDLLKEKTSFLILYLRSWSKKDPVGERLIIPTVALFVAWMSTKVDHISRACTGRSQLICELLI